MRGGGESGVGEGNCLPLPHPWTRLLPAGGKGLDGPAHAHLAAQTCRRPLPQLRKERQSPPWQKFENPEIKKPRRTRPLRNRGSLCSDLPACRRTCLSARGTPALTAEKSPQSLRLAWCVGLRQEDLGVCSGAEDSPIQPLPPTPG